MYLFRLVTLVAVGGALSAPLAAQGIPRNARPTQANIAPRFMVANPFAFAPADSAPAVLIGTGLREEMKSMVGRDFQVVDADWQRWRRALADRPDTSFKHYPALNHLGIAGQGAGTLAEYDQPGHVDAGMIDDVAEWILSTDATE